MATTSKNYKHSKSGKTIQMVAPSSEAPSQYPSEWFHKHPHEKPIASFFKGEMTGDNILGIIMEGITIGHLPVDAAKFGIYHFCKDIKYELDEKWESFGIVFGEKGKNVHVWDLIKITQKDGAVKGLKEKPADDMSTDWVPLYLLSAHRLNNVPTADYLEALKKKILEQMWTLGFPGKTFPSSAISNTWTLDKSYNCMVAAIDMFMFKFPNHEHSIYRLSTIRSRYRDCASLMAISYLTNLLDMKDQSDILDWLYTEKQAEDAIRMMKEGQEHLKLDSYFPYQSDMNIVQKTNYSVTKNPHIYFLIQAVGALLQTTRSKNAKFTTDANLLNNIFNAKVMAFAFSTNVEIVKTFVAEGTDDKENDGESFEDAGELSHMPDDTSGTAWYYYMKSIGCRIPKVMKEFVDEMRSKINDPRVGTVGEFVKEHF